MKSIEKYPNNNFTGISKFLSYVLRHRPDAIGIQLDLDGWTDIRALIAAAAISGEKIDFDLILAVVASNDKQRFAISEDGQRIRAVQGHSMQSVHINYPELQPPEFLYHGTATRFIASILEEGLNSRLRQYVHLSEEREIALEVGRRYGKPVLLQIQAEPMYEQGFKFHQATNGVWLTSSVPPNFIVQHF